jgi:hypothetical protein
MKSTTLLLAAAVTGMPAFVANAQSFIPNTLPAPVGLGAVSNIIMEGNAVAVDSFNSHDPTESLDGLYNAYSGTNGNVACLNGIVNPGNMFIQGNLYLGGTTSYSGSPSQVAGTIYSDCNVAFPPVNLPANDASGNAISWQSAPTTTVNGTTGHFFTTAGYYVINDSDPIEVASNVTVTLDVQTLIFSPSSVTIDGGTIASGTIYMYQESGSATLGGNSRGGAIGNRPENFYYFGLPAVTGISLNSVSDFVGVIYAPSASLYLNGGGNNGGLIGAVIAATVTLIGHYNIHYDTSLPVTNALLLVTQPLGQTVLAGSNVTFNVTAFGEPPMVFQWFDNGAPVGSPVSGVTHVSSYTVTNAQIGDAGTYSVQVTNNYGSAISSNAVLSFYASALSTLSGVATTTGNNVQFTVTGVPGFNYAIQASTDLTDWVTLFTNTSPFTFTDTNAPNVPQQFYRSLYTP